MTVTSNTEREREREREAPVGLVRVLDQLVDGEGGVVGLDDRVGDLGRRHHREGVHDAVGILFADLGDEQRAHARTRSAAQRVRQLKALRASVHVVVVVVVVVGVVVVVAVGVGRTWRQSQLSASLRTTSRTESTSSAPSV